MCRLEKGNLLESGEYVRLENCEAQMTKLGRCNAEGAPVKALVMVETDV